MNRLNNPESSESARTGIGRSLPDVPDCEEYEVPEELYTCDATTSFRAEISTDFRSRPTGSTTINPYDEIPDLNRTIMNIPPLPQIPKKDDRQSWDAPCLLIENNESVSFKVVEETLRRVATISYPVAVVSMVGPCRTGKSSLLNYILGKDKGFEVNSTTCAITKGIWIWCLKHPTDSNLQLLILDTEGLGDTQKTGGVEDDRKIFLLTCLVSSTLVYSSVKTINQEAMNNLSYISQLSEQMSIYQSSPNAEEDQLKLGFFLPNLIWIVKDFDLELDSKTPTPDTYLENCLILKGGISFKIIEYNRIRQCIRCYFKERSCVLFPPPFKAYGRVDQPREARKFFREELNDEYKKSANEFYRLIKLSAPKNINGIIPDGPMFTGMLKRYASMIGANDIPSVEAVLKETVKEANEELLSKCLNFYMESLSQIQLPTDNLDTLYRHHQMCKEKFHEMIKEHYKSLSAEDDEEFHTKLGAELESHFQKFSRNNENVSMDKCRILLIRHMKSVKEKLDGEVYMRSGGYSQYEIEMKVALSNYEKEPNKGIKSKEAVDEYMKKIRPQVEAIICVDNAMTKDQTNRRALELENIYAMKQEEYMTIKEFYQQIEKEMKQLKDIVNRATYESVYDQQMLRCKGDAAKFITFLKKEIDLQYHMGREDNAKYLTEVMKKFEFVNNTSGKGSGSSRGSKKKYTIFGLFK